MGGVFVTRKQQLTEPDEGSICADCPDKEEPAVPAPASMGEKAKWKFAWRIDKYEGEVSPPELDWLKPAETVHIDGNMLVNAGIDRLLDLLIAAGGQAYDNTHARIGVGDSSTAAAASQTDLQAAAGSSHRQFVTMDATYPSRSGEVVTWRATFGTTLANFAWNEACIDVGTANGTTITTPMLNRKIISAGTKTSAQTWVITGTLQIS